MFKLMISFSSNLEIKFGVASHPKEYVLQSADEVCTVIKGLSHLNPIVTLYQLPVMSADQVLEDFKSVEI